MGAQKTRFKQINPEFTKSQYISSKILNVGAKLRATNNLPRWQIREQRPEREASYKLSGYILFYEKATMDLQWQRT